MISTWVNQSLFTAERYLCIPSRLQRDEHPAGLSVMQLCGCSSHMERSNVHVDPASIRCSPDTLLCVHILMKSPVVEKKNPHHLKHDFRYHLDIYQPAYSIKQLIRQSLTAALYLKLDCSWQSKATLSVTLQRTCFPSSRQYFTTISHHANVTLICMAIVSCGEITVALYR